MVIELGKLKLGLKKNPKDLNYKLAAIKCCFGIELTDAKKKAQILRLGGMYYTGVITVTTLLQKQQGNVETSAMLLQEMHNQWRVSRRKLDSKHINDDEEIVLAANSKENGRYKKKVKVTTKCPHCEKICHGEKDC